MQTGQVPRRHAHAARRALRILEAAVAADLDLTAALPELLRAAIRRVATRPSTHDRELRALRQLVDNLRGPDGRPLLRDSDAEPLLQRQTDLLRRGQHDGHLRADEHPDWFHNLQAHPTAGVQIGTRRFTARARLASLAEREALWPQMVRIFPLYEEYADKTDRQIPIVLLTAQH